MEKEKKKRGGYHEKNPGGRPKGKNRVTASICLTHENNAYRKSLGRKWSDYINGLMKKDRATPEQHPNQNQPTSSPEKPQ